MIPVFFGCETTVRERRRIRKWRGRGRERREGRGGSVGREEWVWGSGVAREGGVRGSRSQF